MTAPSRRRPRNHSKPKTAYVPLLTPEDDDAYFHRLYRDGVDPKRTPAQRKAERLSDLNRDQLSIWDAMAARRVESGVGEEET